MDENALAVYEAQSYLRNIKLLEPEITTIVPDGIYGGDTTQAVQDFQQTQGIPQTGSIDYEEWQRLTRENARADFERSLPAQIAPIGNEDLPLRRGDANNLVLTAQQMLLYIALLFENILQVELSGIFDGNTEQATRQWQRVCRLPQSGEIDKQTWNRLARLYTLRLNLRVISGGQPEAGMG